MHEVSEGGGAASGIGERGRETLESARACTRLAKAAAQRAEWGSERGRETVEEGREGCDGGWVEAARGG
jgi:hypothetical protein